MREGTAPASGSEKIPTVEELAQVLDKVEKRLEKIIATASPRLIPLSKWASIGTLKEKIRSADDDQRKKIKESIRKIAAQGAAEEKKIAEVSVAEGASAADITRAMSHFASNAEDLRYATDETLAVILAQHGTKNIPLNVRNGDKIQFLPGTRRFAGLTPVLSNLVDEYNRRKDERGARSKQLENFRAVKVGNDYVVGTGTSQIRVVRSKTGDWYQIQNADGKVAKRRYKSNEVDDALEHAWLKVDKSGDKLLFEEGVDDVDAEKSVGADPRDTRLQAQEEEIRELKEQVAVLQRNAGTAPPGERMAAGLHDVPPPAPHPVHDAPQALHHDQKEHGHDAAPLPETFKTRAEMYQHLFKDAFGAARMGDRALDIQNPAQAQAARNFLKTIEKSKPKWRMLLRGMVVGAVAAAAAAGTIFLATAAFPAVAASMGAMWAAGGKFAAAAALGKMGVGALGALGPAWYTRKKWTEGLNKKFAKGTRFTYDELAKASMGFKKADKLWSDNEDAFLKSQRHYNKVVDADNKHILGGVPPLVHKDKRAFEMNAEAAMRRYEKARRNEAILQFGAGALGGAMGGMGVGTAGYLAAHGAVAPWNIGSGIQQRIPVPPQGPLPGPQSLLSQPAGTFVAPPVASGQPLISSGPASGLPQYYPGGNLPPNLGPGTLQQTVAQQIQAAPTTGNQPLTPGLSTGAPYAVQPAGSWGSLPSAPRTGALVEFANNFKLRADNPSHGFQEIMRGLGFAYGNNVPEFGTAAFRLTLADDSELAAKFFGVNEDMYERFVSRYPDTQQGRIRAFEEFMQKRPVKSFDYSVLRDPDVINEMKDRVREDLDGQYFGRGRSRQDTLEALDRLQEALRRNPRVNLRVATR